MTVLHPHLTSAYKLRRLRISLPLVPHLVDGPKYFRPDDLPPPEGEDLRPLSRPRVGPSWTATITARHAEAGRRACVSWSRNLDRCWRP